MMLKTTDPFDARVRHWAEMRGLWAGDGAGTTGILHPARRRPVARNLGRAGS